MNRFWLWIFKMILIFLTTIKNIIFNEVEENFNDWQDLNIDNKYCLINFSNEEMNNFECFKFWFFLKWSNTKN